MKKISFYHSFKRIDTSLRASNNIVSFSVYKDIGSCAWNDKVGSALTSSFDSSQSRFVSDLNRQFECLKSIDKQLPDGDAFEYQSHRPSILAEIQSCIVGE